VLIRINPDWRFRVHQLRKIVRFQRTTELWNYIIHHVFKTSDTFNLTEREGMLSSPCILNMKRLLIWKHDPFKISSNFRKRLGSLSIVSLNSSDKEEILELQSYSGKRTEFQGKDTGTKW